MKITVAVKLNSKIEAVEKLEDGSFLVRIHTPPVDGKANEKIVELLSRFLKKPKSKFELLSGHRGKRKIFDISD